MKKDSTKEQYIVCIGGANVDRKYRAKDHIMKGTSNPVVSSTSVGGVARNIAENLGRLGNPVKLLTVRGEDSDWVKIENETKAFVDLDDVIGLKEFATGSYTAIINHAGDMEVAYANMDIFDALTVEQLQAKTALLEGAASIVVDLNCPRETIEYVYHCAKSKEIPLIIIPVSSPKMDRLPQVLEGVEWLITNKDESETYFNRSLETTEDWKQMVSLWLQKGIKQVIVTNGDQGVMAGKMHKDGSVEIEHISPIKADNVMDVTGAGDAFCSGVIFGTYHHYSFKEAIQIGMVNAYKTILSPYTVRVELSKEQLLHEMEAFI